MVFPLLLMVTACAASFVPTDLEHQALYFADATSTDHVKLGSSIHTFSAVTVCLRAKTNLCRDHSLFSGSSYSEDNALGIFRDEDDDEIDVFIHGTKVQFKGLNYDPNKLHSICVTWDSATGLVQLWIDGHHAVPKYVGGGPLTDLCIILGQEQDIYNGGFDQNQSFVGVITDLHVWNYVLDYCEIQHYMEDEYFCPGNAVNWRDLHYTIIGNIVLECRPTCKDDLQDKFTQIPYNRGLEYGQKIGSGSSSVVW